MNLLTNAAQALEGRTPAESELRIATRLTAAGEVLIEVKDNGRGMEEEEARRALEPFFTTRPVGGGAGLGLSVAHGIITALGGRIEVETAPGQGAAVRVFLPVAA